VEGFEDRDQVVAATQPGIADNIASKEVNAIGDRGFGRFLKCRPFDPEALPL